MLRFLKESKIILIINRYFFLNSISLMFSFGFLYYVILYVIEKKILNFFTEVIWYKILIMNIFREFE